MLFSRRTLIFAILAVLLLPALIWWGLYEAGMAPPPGEKLNPPFELSDRLVYLPIEEDEEGALTLEFEGGSEGEDDSAVSFTPEEFIREVKDRQPEMGKWLPFFRVMNITSLTGLLWVGLGFLGQALFTGRLLVQWWASEKVKSAVVPPAFWWLSLLGSSMLMVYFVWRVEIVGFLGQSTGWLIYVRNLWFIYGKKAAD